MHGTRGGIRVGSKWKFENFTTLTHSNSTSGCRARQTNGTIGISSSSWFPSYQNWPFSRTFDFHHSKAKTNQRKWKSHSILWFKNIGSKLQFWLLFRSLLKILNKLHRMFGDLCSEHTSKALICSLMELYDNATVDESMVKSFNAKVTSIWHISLPENLLMRKFHELLRNSVDNAKLLKYVHKKELVISSSCLHWQHDVSNLSST